MMIVSFFESTIFSPIQIEFANGFGTAKAGFAVPISPRSPGSSSHFRNPGPSSHSHSPGSNSHFRNPGLNSHSHSPEPGSHFLSPRSQGQSHAAQKTGLILYRRLLQTGYRTLSVPQ